MDFNASTEFDYPAIDDGPTIDDGTRFEQYEPVAVEAIAAADFDDMENLYLTPT
jgi:hypothetical protein